MRATFADAAIEKFLIAMEQNFCVAKCPTNWLVHDEKFSFNVLLVVKSFERHVMNAEPESTPTESTNEPPMFREPLLFYVSLKGFGCVDSNNRLVMGREFSTKRIVAPDNKPLELVIEMLAMMQPYWKYWTLEDLKTDLARLKSYVESLEPDVDEETKVPE